MASCKPKTPSVPNSVSESPASQYLLAGLAEAVVLRAAAKIAVKKPKEQQPRTAGVDDETALGVAHAEAE